MASVAPQLANVSGPDQYELNKESGINIALAQWPWAATALVLCLSAVLLKNTLFSKNGDKGGCDISHIPLMGEGNEEERLKWFNAGFGWDSYVQGYQKFKNQVFRMTVAPKTEHVVLPTKYLPELNKLPDNVLSLNNLLQDRLQNKHTFGTNPYDVEGEPSPLLVVSRTTLTSSCPRFTNLLAEGVFEDMDRDLPSASDWTEVPMYKTITRLVSRVSARVFVGNDMCYNDTYVDNAAHYSVELYKAGAATSALPGFLRPLFAQRLPAVKSMLKSTNEAMELLRPPVTQRVREMAEQGENFEKPDDVLQCVINAVKLKPEDGRDGEDQVTMAQLSAHVAAIDSPTMTVTDSIYTLASDPEMLAILREDIEQGMEQDGGKLSSASLAKMHKLDSFLKEIMRLYALKANTFTRYAMKTFRLSDGLVIPAGSTIEMPWAGISVDSDFYPEPEKFDGLRFYNLSKAEGFKDNNDNRFVGATPECLTWGYGKHACPGRYFVVNELKVIVAGLVLNYDFRMPDGVEGRYKNLKIQGHQVPDTKKMIMVKRR